MNSGTPQEGPKEGATSFSSKRRKSFASCWKQSGRKIPLTLEKRRFFLRQTIRSAAFPKLNSNSISGIPFARLRMKFDLALQEPLNRSN